MKAQRSYALAQILGNFRTRFGYIGRGWSREKYLQTIQTVFPDIGRTEAEKILRSYWVNHQKRFFELFLAPELNPENLGRIVQFQGLEHLDKALAQGKGAILPVPHLGNERLHHIALAIKGYPMAVISSRYEDHGPYARRIKLDASRRIHEVGYAGDTAWLLRMLKSNRLLQVACDAEAGANGVYTSFLGQEVLLPTGWVRLALSTGAAVLPSMLLRQDDGTHLLVVHSAFEFDRSLPREELLAGSVQRFMDLMAESFKQRPDQVDWMSLTVRLEETQRAREDTLNC